MGQKKGTAAYTDVYIGTDILIYLRFITAMDLK